MLLHILNCTGQPPENYLAQMSIPLKLRNPELKGKQTKTHRGTKGSFLNYYLFHVFNNLEKEIDPSSHTHRLFCFLSFLDMANSFQGIMKTVHMDFLALDVGWPRYLFCATAVALFCGILPVWFSEFGPSC